MSKLNIGIAGLGNVGSALVETIEVNKNYFFDKKRCRIEHSWNICKNKK